FVLSLQFALLRRPLYIGSFGLSYPQYAICKTQFRESAGWGMHRYGSAVWRDWRRASTRTKGASKASRRRSSWSSKTSPNTARYGKPVQPNTLISPVMFGEISLAPAGMSARFVLPPGQRTQICVGGVGVPMTRFALSCDQ